MYEGQVGRTQRVTVGNCVVEALYSMSYNGRLASSCDDTTMGHRFLKGAPGIYVFGDAFAHKAHHYMHWVPLFDDGVFWAIKLEVEVDRKRKVVTHHKDQWVQQPGSAAQSLMGMWMQK